MGDFKDISVRLYKVSRPIVNRLFPWICFWGIFAWVWRVRDLVNTIPGYGEGDALEVVWGIRYYYDSLFVKHTLPLFTPLIFHPWGWYTATLAHTPVFFLAALPLYKLGGVAFAYNGLAILASVVAFAGVCRFARLFTSQSMGILAALAFTFVNMRWFRIGCHLHILWASSLLPWLAWIVESANHETEGMTGKTVWRAGWLWGMMINASLYSIFLGGLVFIILGKKLFQLQNILRLLAVAAVAILIASPTIVLYWQGSQLSQAHHFGIIHNVHWGASLNSLFAPSADHPLKIVREASRILYNGTQDESGISNMGFTTCLLALVGLLIVTIKKHSRWWSLAWLTIGGMVFAMGLLLKWNGGVVPLTGIQGFNETLWRIGHALKPELFPTASLHPSFQSGIPLPGLIMTIFVPFWESARVMSRYAFLAMLGAVTLAAITLQKSPKVIRYLLAFVWLLEILPPPSSPGVPVNFQPHPAYVWLTTQSLETDEGIIDIVYPTLSIGGDKLIAASMHGKPITAGVGSFWPEPIFRLWEYFLPDGAVLAQPQIGAVLQQYHVRYLFLHMSGDKEQGMWRRIAGNSALRVVDCFDPVEEVTPWPYPICVAEVNPATVQFNVVRESGWSGQEGWGIWSESPASEAKWIAITRQDYHLKLEAFPLCVPGRRQKITIKVNGQALASHPWQACETWAEDLLIPSSFIEVGWNQLTFEYDYALSPFEVTGGTNPDTRLLGIGFVRLEVTE